MVVDPEKVPVSAAGSRFAESSPGLRAPAVKRPTPPSSPAAAMA